LLDAKDVLLHFLIYFFFTLLLFFGANKFSSRFLLGYKMAVIVLVSVALGLAIELIQEIFIEGRHFEWADLFFNTLGTLIILPLNRILKRR
jgi:VanZ family protein